MKQKFKDYYMMEERLSVANQIVGEIKDIITKSTNPFLVQKYVEEHICGRVGGVRLGNGAFSSVYGGVDGGYVVKLAMNDKAFQRFINKTKSYNNPLIPKVITHLNVPLNGVWHFDVYVLEKLKVDVDTNMDFFHGIYRLDPHFKLTYKLGDIMAKMLTNEIEEETKPKIDQFLHPYNRTYDQLLEFGELVSEITGSPYKNDIHHLNYGFDKDGGLVIFDPVAISKET